MTRPTPRTRGEELLLARVSAAAGRAHLGKRRATYPGAAHTRPARARWLPATKATADVRLDLYEQGMTIAVKGRIHVVRYDTTTVRHDTACTVTDIEGKQVVLYVRPEEPEASGAEVWVTEIRRAVARAQLPRALAALDNGERLTFGDIWLTRERIGSGDVSARWPQVRQLDITKGVIRLNIDGNWHNLGPTESEIPNFSVFHAVVDCLRADGARP
ncbi:hypothetical protein SSP35_02_01080 [Streptomyces sp. NBRC 110611]|uniref:DUF6585 family protein n=1 Tax=Streptomyces sp. NBRC 110611 TaxID=1621259 RepID=UPI00082C41D7|nr:DUF6585 family protein [Streptomyces sp. NBRC 110611]GAU65741.1 hypothetical protein SSP35_02_01080 [Streptomyces sp. NBRC 110611]